MKVDRSEISRKIVEIVDGKRVKMKVVLDALSDMFPDIAFIAIDQRKDEFLYGLAYAEAMEDKYSEEFC